MGSLGSFLIIIFSSSLSSRPLAVSFSTVPLYFSQQHQQRIKSTHWVECVGWYVFGEPTNREIFVFRMKWASVFVVLKERQRESWCHSKCVEGFFDFQEGWMTIWQGLRGRGRKGFDADSQQKLILHTNSYLSPPHFSSLVSVLIRFLHLVQHP